MLTRKAAGLGFQPYDVPQHPKSRSHLALLIRDALEMYWFGENYSFDKTPGFEKTIVSGKE